MASYFGIHGDGGNFFTNYFQTGGTSQGISLGDYASIQNGTYKKLLSAYYEKKEKTSKGEETAAKGESLAGKKTAGAAADASALANAASGLMKRGSASVFSLKEMEVADEKTGQKTKKKAYDRDAIYTAVKGFVDKYNALVDSGSELDNTNILRNTLNLTKMTKANAGILSDVGIKIGDGSKLVLDKEKLSKASIKDLENIFQGNGSFGSQVVEKATSIAGAAAVENAKASGTYSNTGAYSKYLDTGKIYKELL